MRIVILANGTRGDVQPMVALGKGLQLSGHKVKVVTHDMFEPMVRRAGVEFFGLHSSFKEIFKSGLGQAASRNGTRPLHNLRRLSKAFIAGQRKAGPECWEACQDADIICDTLLSFFIGESIAEALHIPTLPLLLLPLTPTTNMPVPLLTVRDMGRFLNLFTYRFCNVVAWIPFRRIINKWRKARLKLDPLGINYVNRVTKYREDTGLPTIYGFSEHLIPRPSDWGKHIHITGYWRFEDAAPWQPSNGLMDFMEAGSPPVYIDFGSMVDADAERTTALVVKALEKSGQRGLISTGWGGLYQADLPKHVFSAGAAPHRWVLPRVAAIVHHGGIGTIDAALCRGLPNATVPFFPDQLFLGHRIAAAGVGPEPIPHRELTAERLAKAIRTIATDQTVRDRAKLLGRRMRDEDGVGKAVKIINRYINT